MAAERVDVVVLGGGAAGLFCAIQAGKRGRSVLVLERAREVGKKIAISGGGRCNFTNLFSDPSRFLSANPDFCRSALARYRPEDFVALVEAHGIAWHEKKLGQLFCDGSSRDIVRMLLDECRAAAVEVRVGCEVRGVERSDGFRIETDRGALGAERLVVATGGLSIPKVGATDLGYRIARRFGLAVLAPRPGLVPLTLGGEERILFGKLAGVSFDSIVSAGGARFREHTLFTHRGLSGPAILQASSYWQPGRPIAIDVLPAVDVEALFAAERRNAVTLANLLARSVPKRFAAAWCASAFDSRPMNLYSASELAEIARRLRAWSIQPADTEGFGKAEVTCGGVDTAELSSRTMEARRVPGLHFIGEVVDVTGHLGGHNFQWAWASAFAAGNAL